MGFYPVSSTVKHRVKEALVGSSMLQMASHFARPSAVILTHHSVVEEPSQTDPVLGTSVSRAIFEAQMRALAQHFSPVTMEDVASFVSAGRKLPRHPVALTFDDGFADNFEVALPILNRLGIPATFYIMVDAVATGRLPWYCRIRWALHSTRKLEWTDPCLNGKSFRLGSAEQLNLALNSAWELGAALTGESQQAFVNRVEHSLDIEPHPGEHGFMMTWDQVRKLKADGHTVGAHTLSHPNVAQISKEEARSEIVGSKKRLEEELGEPIQHFSYPHPALNPQWSAQTLEITREAGFKSAVLTAPGRVTIGDNPLALTRIAHGCSLLQFMWNVEATFLGRIV